MILPALTEATSPFWRPIKYSLFPPLGLATLAGYLDRRRRGRDPGRARRAARPGRRAGPGGDPGLHHLGAPRVRARRPLPRTRRVRGARRPARHVAARRGRRARRHDLPRPRRGHLAAVPRRLPARRARRASTSRRLRTLGGPAADPPRPDQAPPLPRAELDRRLARLPARLRLLLQGGVLRRRPVVLHADGRRRARRDRAPARPAPLLPRRPPVRRPRASPTALFDGMRGMGRLWQAAGTVNVGARARPARAGRRRRPAQPVRRLRDAQPGQPARAAQVPEPATATTPPPSAACTTSA